MASSSSGNSGSDCERCLCRLISRSLRPHSLSFFSPRQICDASTPSEKEAPPLTEEMERDLLISLSAVSRDTKRLTSEFDRSDPDLDGETCSRMDNTYLCHSDVPLEEGHVCLANIISLLMNTTHTGLKRILVGEGIKIKLEGVQEATFVLPSDLGLLLNKSLLTLKEHRRQFWPHKYPECTPLLSVYIQGPASVSAYRVRNPRASIGTLFHSPDVVDLLPEKRYDSSHFNHHPLFSILSLHSKLNLLDKIFRIILGNKIQNGGPHIVKAKIATSTLVKFWLELERDITPDYRLWKKVAEWKTRPVVERVQFEVVARVEEGRALKPVLFNKLKKPFGVETSAWSNLMSNISFTKIPSLVVPPEPLTLDVKW